MKTEKTGYRRNPSWVFIVLIFVFPWTQALGKDRNYLVRKGDKLSIVAARFGLKSKDLVDHNNLRNSNRIYIGQKLKIPSRPVSYNTYTVSMGDTLAAISRKFRSSVSDIVSLNRLKDPNKLQVGQKLKVPIADSSSTTSSGISTSLRSQLNGVRLKRGGWKYIVIHHTATNVGEPKSFDSMHRRRGMENGLAYHFLIGNGKGMGDGEIFVGNRWTKQIQGGHVKGSALNIKSLGIALVGDFESKKPSARQLRSLDFLTEYLAERCRIKKKSIFPHQRFYQQKTKCPGKNFPIKTFLKNLNL